MNFENFHCLLVEDTYSNLVIYKRILEDRKITVTESGNGVEGLMKFKEKHPPYFDIIITDLRMPEMNGKKMIQKIRNFEKESGRNPTPIIVISGDPSENEKANLLKVGANMFMSKPIRAIELISNISKLTKNVEKEELKEEEEIKEVLPSILMIEDDVISSNLFNKFFQKKGIWVYQAYTLSEVREYILSSGTSNSKKQIQGNWNYSDG